MISVEKVRTHDDKILYRVSHKGALKRYLCRDVNRRFLSIYKDKIELFRNELEAKKAINTLP